MKFAIPSVLVTLSMALPVVGETPAAAPQPAAEARQPTAEELRAQLIAAANEAQQALEKASADGPHHHLIPNFLGNLESLSPLEPDPRQIRILLGPRSLPNIEAFRKTRELAEAYVKQLETEINEKLKAFETEFVGSIKSMLKEVLATDDPQKIRELADKLSRRYSDANSELPHGYRSSSTTFLNDSSQVNQFTNRASRFHAARKSESWGTAASNLQEMESAMRQLDRYIPSADAAAYLAAARKSIGLLPPDEMKALFARTLDELLDDANQDRIADIQKAIKIQRDLQSYVSDAGFSQQWQMLDSLASGLAQNVRSMKLGGASRFGPDQWLRSNSPTQIISRDDLIGRLKRYQVSIKGPDGGVLKEPMYLDPEEVMARIKTPSDIARESASLGKAVRQQESSSESGNWSAVLTRLNQISELHAKLESGVPFPLALFERPDYSGSAYTRMTGVKDSATQKTDDLNRQVQWMILQRFFPDVAPAPDASSQDGVSRRFEEAKAKGDYAAMLTLNQLSMYFTPGQMLMAPQAALAIQHYLSGVKQEEQLEQPRLAVYYFQRAAAIPACPVPISELKRRLQGIRKKSADAYEKGTEDSLKSTMESPVGTYQNVLMVPAAPKAADGGATPEEPKGP